MAISASLILVFASNTAVIGAYHVFLALARMDFFPEFILKRNTFRGTPHWSIALATGIPIAVLVLVHGKINILGDMYAFGLLGAFTVTCLGLDIIRYRERRGAQASPSEWAEGHHGNGISGSLVSPHASPSLTGHRTPSAVRTAVVMVAVSSLRKRLVGLYHRLDFWLGVLTTLLVMLAWSISIFSKPLATAFGGAVALAGMSVAYVNHVRGRSPAVVPYLEGRLPGSVLAVLTAGDEQNDRVIDAAINSARGKPVVFLYLAEPKASRVPRLFEVADPYLEDQPAKDTLKQAVQLARKAKLARRFVYRQQAPEAAARIWQMVHPHEVVPTAENASQCEEINPDRIRYELTPGGKIAHLLKRW